MLEAMPPGQRLFVLLIAVTGMRVGEALALRWTDFVSARSGIRVNHTLYRDTLKQPKTESSRRTIRLAASVTQQLASHRAQSSFQAEEDFIFSRPDGRHLDDKAVRRSLYRAMKQAEIHRTSGKHGFHIFRHSAGTLLYSRSRDLKLVQGMLGHADISITSDIYVHLEDRVKAEGTELLAEEILGNCDQIVTQSSRMVS
ncbi:MAG TPA: site-specific integrase [Blastocatellia bacterium]|nr:site-specific integrase [Blastocatellia bacterium]